MFTGIVEELGEVVAVAASPGSARLTVRGPLVTGDAGAGDSIAVNGVCLTAVGTGDETVSVDLIPETLQRSNLGSLVEESRVNLERPMPASGRFDGHIVQGHVDGLGTVKEVVHDADGGVLMTIEVPDDLRRYLIEKGSVTIDGVSLTVASLTESGFGVALIPHTLEVTTLGLRAAGDTVNLEMDVLAKYVERLLKQ